ncbi:MAG TPA: hypothetical protein VHS09_07405, partial [Polyangiaceae bacterium]|nr:hypothetical protein [Polyangiaceae bacterium]
MTIARRLLLTMLAALAAFSLFACSHGPEATGPSVGPPSRLELRAVAPESPGVEHVPSWEGAGVAVGEDRLVLDGGVRAVRVVRDPERDGVALSLELADDTRQRVAQFTGAHVGTRVAVIVAGRAAMTMTVRDPVSVPALLLTARDDATVRELD